MIKLKQIDHVILMVENMNRSIEFYRDVLGFSLKFSSENWTEINTGATTLALHSGGKKVSSENSPAPHKSIAGTASISFNVENVDEVYSYLISKGVKFSLAPTPRPNEGIKLAIAVDPDGFEICFAEQIKK